MARVGLAVRDRAGLVTPGDPAVRDPVDQAGRAARGQADRVGPVGLVGRVGLEDMNRVAPGVLEDMGPADPADLASLGVRGQVGLEDMDPADLAGLGLGVPNRVALAAPEDLDLGVRNQAGRRPGGPGSESPGSGGSGSPGSEPGPGASGPDANGPGPGAAGPDASGPDRARLDLMPARLDRMPARLDRMRRADRTHPADRLWEPMSRVEATRPEARMHLAEVTRLAEATRVEATRRVGATRRAKATHLVEQTQPGGADSEGDRPADATQVYVGNWSALPASSVAKILRLCVIRLPCATALACRTLMCAGAPEGSDGCARPRFAQPN